MWTAFHKRKLSSSQIILFGFAGVILIGALLCDRVTGPAPGGPAQNIIYHS